MLSHKEIYHSDTYACLLVMKHMRAVEYQEEISCWILGVDLTEEKTWAIKAEYPQFTKKAEISPCF